MITELKEFWSEEDGMGTVELIMIIGVLVALVLVFRKQVKNVITNWFSKINTSAEQLWKTSI